MAYLLPVYGIALGALVLGEPVDARLILGTLLVIAGIALVNLRGRWMPLLGRRKRCRRVRFPPRGLRAK